MTDTHEQTQNQLVPDMTPATTQAGPNLLSDVPVHPPRHKPFPTKLIIIICAVVLIIGVGGIAFSLIKTTQNNIGSVTPTPIVTETPSPTPIRAYSAIASQSAFIELESNIQTLTGELQGNSLSDPTLQPPTLKLPLGFSK